MTELLTVEEVAEILRKDTRYVRVELRAKRLAGSKFGGAWHIRPADVQTYIDAHRNVSRVQGKAS